MKNGKDGHETKTPTVMPAGTIYEENAKIRLSLEMPGVRKEDLEIRIEDNELKVRGKRREEVVNGRFLIAERSRGEYARVFTLDETIDREKIEAVMENGVLLLTLDRKESEKPRKIEVKAG